MEISELKSNSRGQQIVGEYHDDSRTAVWIMVLLCAVLIVGVLVNLAVGINPFDAAYAG